MACAAVNRRMDAWTTLDHVDLTTVATSEAELSAVVTESGGRTRNQKRKIEDVHEEEEHHGEFDQNALREHEEFTKVKNVERIELGRYEMETWYFSPLPQEYNMCKVCSFFNKPRNAFTLLVASALHTYVYMFTFPAASRQQLCVTPEPAHAERRVSKAHGVEAAAQQRCPQLIKCLLTRAIFTQTRRKASNAATLLLVWRVHLHHNLSASVLPS
jgi:hypothetical protein